MTLSGWRLSDRDPSLTPRYPLPSWNASSSCYGSENSRRGTKNYYRLTRINPLDIQQTRRTQMQQTEQVATELVARSQRQGKRIPNKMQSWPINWRRGTHDIIVRRFIILISPYRCGRRRGGTPLGHGPFVVHEGVQQRVGGCQVVRLGQSARLRQLECGVRRNVLRGF